MRRALIPFLRCPRDGSALSLVNEEEADAGEVWAGVLISETGNRYAIEAGVPNLTIGFRSAAERSTVEAFGREWRRYTDFSGFMGSSALFTQFTGLGAEDIAGKRVLEVGCGGGRWLRVMAALGARDVVGLEYSEAAYQAATLVAGLPNVHVIRGSALAPPLARCFDLIVSIGVVHHLDDPVAGLSSMKKAAASDHRVVIWVYAHEGNELYLSVVDPIRRITSRLPEWLLVPLSKSLASVLWLHIRTSNRVAARMGLRLPLRDYLEMLRPLRYRDLESVAYDQLTPQLARYPRRDEVLAWVADAGGVIDRVHHRTANSWQVHFRYQLPATLSSGER